LLRYAALAVSECRYLVQFWRYSTSTSTEVVRKLTFSDSQILGGREHKRNTNVAVGKMQVPTPTQLLLTDEDFGHIGAAAAAAAASFPASITSHAWQ